MAAPAPTPPPVLTPEQAKGALEQIYERFTQPEVKQRLEALVEECNKTENPIMAKMMKFPGVVSELLADLMAELGFQQKDIMAGVMQIQMHAAKDPSMASKVGILMQAFSGNIPKHEESTTEAEICD